MTLSKSPPAGFPGPVLRAGRDRADGAVTDGAGENVAQAVTRVNA
ncbi:hypothetical protein GLA29479_1569 [Lysobacter antibioticus]|uniref:Uncharacterized protein n=1 Tax=Lysobacter antibioticus TaxID=84531 RepID=A0A0S2DVY5_LYSAN|nr:hypothetical protein GLA29479_1569 [Lysobacter antibioticus]ALN80082.1 hypothetical protein LA76x_1938 [Lysobacter antibioticus]